MTFSLPVRCASGLLLMALSAIGTASSALAADTIVLTYGVLEASISVDELTTFAETGEQSSRLKRYVRMSGQEPGEIRRTLTREVEIDVVTLDAALNNPIGEAALDQVGDVIYMRSGSANRQALRSALVLSASDDDKLSLLEVMQNYPTSEVMVDGKRLASAYERIADLSDRAQDLMDLLNLDLLNLLGRTTRSLWGR